jgi:DNA-binding transcriptional ArsR family regulator
MIGPGDYLRIVLDPVRLTVLGHAAAGDLDPDALAEQLEVKPRVISDAIGRLRAAGLVTPDLVLDVAELRRIAGELPQAPPIASQITEKGTWTPEEADILGRFFSGARLREIPSSRSKRRVILERLAQEFEPGVRYQEPEVNFTLQMFHRDHASLRRYLVDEGMMTRADGVYWRTGGRYEDDAADA